MSVWFSNFVGFESDVNVFVVRKCVHFFNWFFGKLSRSKLKLVFETHTTRKNTLGGWGPPLHTLRHFTALLWRVFRLRPDMENGRISGSLRSIFNSVPPCAKPRRYTKRDQNILKFRAYRLNIKGQDGQTSRQA